MNPGKGRALCIAATLLLASALAVGVAAALRDRAPRLAWVSSVRTFRYTFPIHGCPSSYGRTHHDYPATDIFAGRGCHFVAPIDGRVDEVSRVDDWSPSTDRGSQRGGRYVSIIGNDGVRYYGSHLMRVARGIRPGVLVRRGQTLGFVGHSGDASATHPHFGISWPTRRGIWWVRRGEVWPWPFLDAWRSGYPHRSPVRRVAAALARAGRRVPRCSVDC
jgi:murein DD-endopeptidase MepM/ murein hydrolase activator NlpD